MNEAKYDDMTAARIALIHAKAQAAMPQENPFKQFRDSFASLFGKPTPKAEVASTASVPKAKM